MMKLWELSSRLVQLVTFKTEYFSRYIDKTMFNARNTSWCYQSQCLLGLVTRESYKNCTITRILLVSIIKLVMNNQGMILLFDPFKAHMNKAVLAMTGGKEVDEEDDIFILVAPQNAVGNCIIDVRSLKC